ncbi:MAG TPA: peptidyl-prolyl cis-trans isomerase [Rhizomicrobium sp.]
MLQQMRKFTKSWVSSIFLGALALSFVVWGIADVFRGTTETNAFILGSTAVPVETFSREYRNLLRRQAAVLTPEQSKLAGKQVLDQLALRTALDIETGRLGLTASDARIQQEIQSVPRFNGPLGSFDHQMFLQQIQQDGYSEDEYIARSRLDIARAQMIRAVQGGFGLPADYPRAIFAFINELRAAEYVMLPAAAAGDVAPPGDAVLAAYVRTQPDAFSTPEYRSVSLASIRLDDVAKTIPVTDKQVADEIDANKADYITPEKRGLEQIQFPSEAEAKAAKAALDAGKSFAALAAERHLAAKDYQLGEVVQADLDAPRATALFALPAQGISAPVKSTFGWVIMHVAAIAPGSSKSRDEVKTIVQRKLALAKMADIANAFTDAVGGGASVEEAAQKAGMTFRRIAAVDAKGLAPDGSKAIDPANPDLTAAIFKAEVGEDGDPFQTPNGDNFALKVDGVTPPKLRTLDAVRAEATARWIAERKLVQLRAKAAALTALANRDHSLAPVAASLGAPVQKTDALTRRTNKGLMTAAVVRAIFDAPPGGTVFVPAADGYIVARVSGIAHHPLQEASAEFLGGAREFSNDVAGNLIISLAEAIEDKEGLTVNQKVVDGAVGNSGSGS